MRRIGRINMLFIIILHTALVCFSVAYLYRVEQSLDKQVKQGKPLTIIQHLLYGACWFYGRAYDLGEKLAEKHFGPEEEE